MSHVMKAGSVLIVDDTPINIQVLVNALKDTYRVRIANEGRKALSVAASEDPPDIILLDVMMPEMDGYEVCRCLKQNPKTMQIPVIFVTTRRSSEDEAFGLNLGAVDYISKPFSIPVVKARVRTHLQLKLRTDKLEALAMVDGLTGIANRRSFDQTLDLDWRRAQRMGSHLSLIMIDIDEFKAYNDNYGHGAGDECLRVVAEAIESIMRRPGDFVGRYGGEEFVVLLPESDLKGTLAMAEKIRLAVKALKIPHAFSGTADHVTISLGCHAMLCESKTSSRQLLQEADQALYFAKQKGRDRVVASNASQA
ncbi:diguanylate cyclase domain-containing protein [uncultured Desulfobacter sp.]|uniref:diguanylate cyclase domain-containing protein n=1 Tax=uncultured Desulfobacter sp. TaxID=240139 RepID=UPI002AAB163A|nr:diguanylate cyclase [uncultured Desulfobacter sp.]